MDENHQQWSLQENSVFEKALAFHDPNSSDFFQRIATKIPEKSVQQINDHFQSLVEDIRFIEENCFFSPNCIRHSKKSQTSSSNRNIVNNSVHQTIKKGARWTKEEHEKFLMGLRRYGKGDWRNISRNCVLTKTATQVASHAQKYFIRLSKSSSTSQHPSNLNPNIINILATNTNQHSI